MSLPMMKQCCTSCFTKQTSQVCLMLQRANCQGQCTLYTREQSGEMEQKGKDMGEKSNLVCMVMVFVAMKSELTRVSFVCPLKGFSCDTQQSSVV